MLKTERNGMRKVMLGASNIHDNERNFVQKEC
jgi:hypothetical protein